MDIASKWKAIIDGLNASKEVVFIFKSGDTEYRYTSNDLRNALAKSKYARELVITALLNQTIYDFDLEINDRYVPVKDFVEFED